MSEPMSLIEFAELFTGIKLLTYQKDMLSALSCGDRIVIRQYRASKRFTSAEIEELKAEVKTYRNAEESRTFCTGCDRRDLSIHKLQATIKRVSEELESVRLNTKRVGIGSVIHSVLDDIEAALKEQEL